MLQTPNSASSTDKVEMAGDKKINLLRKEYIAHSVASLLAYYYQYHHHHRQY